MDYVSITSQRGRNSFAYRRACMAVARLGSGTRRSSLRAGVIRALRGGEQEINVPDPLVERPGADILQP